jgi:hypothetical protein
VEKEVQAGIKVRIRDGSQRIVFTSPESLLGSLRLAVYDAARRGFLRFLAIDEAHIVEQWGDEFRSSFQELAGIRRDLRRQISDNYPAFSTLLLTATLTDTAFDTLETLFGDGQALTTISAAQLRPEPSYWAVRMSNEDERRTAVLEAIRHLPRPLMLYVTQPSEAENWTTILRAEGYGRLDIVTGHTPNVERGQIIERWREAKTDIIVATSAFGLGVDQADVRCVVHATVPENVDRFYQEVGRGGRDGHASGSLVLFTQDDVRRAKNMNRKKIIGITRGRERWSRMFEMQQDLGSGRIRVPIDARPNLTDGIEMDNDMNRAWNIRTLTLMSRASVLSFDAEPPPAFPVDTPSLRTDDQTQNVYSLMFSEHERHRVVSLNSDGTLIGSLWEKNIEPLRRKIAAADARSHALMLELLEGNRCSAEIFQEAYGIAAKRGEIHRREVSVAPACGGCRYCRSIARSPYASPLPTPLPDYATKWNLGPSLRMMCGHTGAVAVFYSRTPSDHEWARIIRWLIGQGIQLIIASKDFLSRVPDSLYQQDTNHPPVFSFNYNGFRFMHAPLLPAMVFLPSDVTLTESMQRSFDSPSPGVPLRVLFAPVSTPDASNPSRRLTSALKCRTFHLEEIREKIGL